MKTKEEWVKSLHTLFFQTKAHILPRDFIDEVAQMLELRDNKISQDRELLYDMLRFSAQERREKAFQAAISEEIPDELMGVKKTNGFGA